MGQTGDWPYTERAGGRDGGPAVPPQWQQGRPGPYQAREYQPQAYQRPQPQAPQFVPRPPPDQRPVKPAPQQAPGTAVKPKAPAAPKAAAKPSAKGCGCLAALLAAVGLVAWFLVSVYGGSGDSPPPAAAPATTSATQAKAQARTQAMAAACAEKAPGPDTYVRTVNPGEDTMAEDTGGAWQWNYGKGQCMPAVQYALSQAVPFGGDCVTVAYAKDNPGYDTGSDPAPPLNDVIASAGPGC